MPSLKRDLRSNTTSKTLELNSEGSCENIKNDNGASKKMNMSPAEYYDDVLNSPSKEDEEVTKQKQKGKSSPLRRKKKDKSPAPAAKDSDAPSNTQNQPTTVSTSVLTPSPYQVTSDLIDATCHEILNLKGNDDTESSSNNNVPIKSYTLHSQRLDYYMKQLNSLAKAEKGKGGNGDDSNNEKQPPLTVRCRLFMATLAMDVAAKAAYPEESQQQQSNLPPLIELTAPQWNEMRQGLGKLRDKITGGKDDDENIDPSFESLVCQIEALEGLAKLRSQLLEVISEIDEGGDGGGKKKKKKKSASHFSYVKDYLEEYKTSAEVIIGKLQNIHQTNYYSDLFVPSQILTYKRCTTIERVKDSVLGISVGIDEMITKKVFPLPQFQTLFLKLLKDWEKSYLPTPVLFKNGYFKCQPAEESSSPKAEGASQSAASGSSQVSSPAGVARERKQQMPAKAAPRKDALDFDDSDDSMVYRVKRTKQTKAKVVKAPSGISRGYKRPPKKKAQYDSDSDSLLSDDTSPPPVQKKKKRVKRIPYTDEEKKTLLLGVERFGKGNWAQIRSYYSDVFKKNGRSGVQLKDLYRTLTKGEG